MNKYEQLIEHIINDDEAKARALFHQIVVEKSRDIYESLMDEEYAEEDIHAGNPVESMMDEITGDETYQAEEEELDMDPEMGMDDMGMDSEMDDDSMGMDDMDSDEESEDDMDLEAIIRELEKQVGDDETEEGMYEAEEEEEAKNENLADGSEAGTDKGETPKVVVTNEEAEEDDKKDDVIDLEEILREMEKDMKDGKEKVEEAEEEDAKEMKADLQEAYKTIKSLQKTINEVNLLNAKLLYTNKLFRGYNLTNEQKVKVVENLDRTSNVREVKLVYATLSESMKFTGTERKVAAKKSITEGLASKPSASTAPKKQIISENTNELAKRFQELAGITRK